MALFANNKDMGGYLPMLNRERNNTEVWTQEYIYKSLSSNKKNKRGRAGRSAAYGPWTNPLPAARTPENSFIMYLDATVSFPG